MTRIASVCALCGSRQGSDFRYRTATIELGRVIAERGVRLVYGGGAVGLMGLLAESVLANGGHVVGVIPDFLMRREVAHTSLSDLVITGSMHDRKTRMFEMADAFVVLPGGLGTLDEAFELITWKQLGLHDCPIVVLDVGGYWRPLLALVESVIDHEFASPPAAALFKVVSTPEDVLPTLEAERTAGQTAMTSHL